MKYEVRDPQAGIWGFYPINKNKLIKEIEEAFINKELGPGDLPKRYINEVNIVGGIVPHAGYQYSGACASWFYKKLAENEPKIDTVIILGTNHSGFGGRITTTTYFSRWATPLGDIEVDIELIKILKENYKELTDDPLAHMREHSIEVQLPFLQYIYKDFKLVPIVVREIDYEEAQLFAKVLYETIIKSNKSCIVIASSDFTHHGAIYDYILFTSDISDKVRKLDMMFIDRIIDLDTKGFLELIQKYNATICGYGAIAITIEYVKLLNGKAKLLKYYHSGDVTGDEDVIVGYAAIAFQKERYK
ncbi:MAG: AmmeMemoRadiSam system protein B [Ignisphaera sp.]